MVAGVGSRAAAATRLCGGGGVPCSHHTQGPHLQIGFPTRRFHTQTDRDSWQLEPRQRAGGHLKMTKIVIHVQTPEKED